MNYEFLEMGPGKYLLAPKPIDDLCLQDGSVGGSYFVYHLCRLFIAER